MRCGTPAPPRAPVTGPILGALVVIVVAALSAGGCSAGTRSEATSTTAAQDGARIATSVPAGQSTTGSEPVAVSVPPAQAVGSSNSTKTYADPGGRYTFLYPRDWRLSEDVIVHERAGGRPLGAVGVFDPRGDTRGEVLLNGVVLAVYSLEGIPGDARQALLEQQLTSVLSDLERELTDPVVVEPLRATSFRGLPGYETTYAFADGETIVRSRMLFLFGDDEEYQITEQAVDASWAETQPALDLVLGSVSLLP